MLVGDYCMCLSVTLCLTHKPVLKFSNHKTVVEFYGFQIPEYIAEFLSLLAFHICTIFSILTLHTFLPCPLCKVFHPTSFPSPVKFLTSFVFSWLSLKLRSQTYSAFTHKLNANFLMMCCFHWRPHLIIYCFNQDDTVWFQLQQYNMRFFHVRSEKP